MNEKDQIDQTTAIKNGKFKIPKRLCIIIMAALATAIQYTIRSNLSVALVAMVNNTDIIKSSSNDRPKFIGCPVPNLDLTNSTTNPSIMHELKGEKLNYQETTQGFLLGAFYYGYILTHVFAGQISSNFGAKNCIFYSLLFSSILTLATHYSTNFDPIFIITLRVTTGMAQGILSPAIYTLFSNWVPKSERSTAFSSITIGGNIGAVLTMPISGYLCEYGNFFNLVEGWPLVFYYFGILGLIFTVLWYFFVYEMPSKHPRISNNEINKIVNDLDFLKEAVEQSTISFKLDKNDNKQKKLNVKKLGSDVPWKKMLKSKQVWVVACAKFCVSWGNLMLMTKLPAYLERILHMPMDKNSMINSIIYVSVCVSAFVFGYLSDYTLRKGYIGKLASRKLFESIALFGSGGCLILIAFAECDENKIIFLMILSAVFYAAISGGDTVIVLDLTSAYSGSVYGLTNSIASIPGFLAPVFVGVLLNNYGESIQTWNYIFITSGGIAVFGGFIFLIFAECEQLSWGRGLLRKTKSVLSMKLSIRSVKSAISLRDKRDKNLV